MKVLIIRFSSIGDIVLTSPVIRCIREQTGAEVHFLTKASFASILTANPHLKKVWTIEKDISEILPALMAAAFTHVIDLHVNLRTTLLRVAFFRQLWRKRPAWYRFDKLNFRKHLLVNFGINRMPDVHIVDRYLAAAHPLHVANDQRGLEYFIAPDDHIDLIAHQLPTDYLVLVIGAAHATKRLTIPQMRQFCADFPFPVCLLGGPAELDAGNRIAAGLTDVFNLCGRFSLGGSADIIRQAQAVVTHDTGMMHIAAAFRKPMLSVWGNTVPDFGMYPYLPGEEAVEKQRRQEVTGLSCRPCSRIGHQQCPEGHFRCIKDQQPAVLVTAARQLMVSE